jgi:ABC-type branched-subunit amino acid transport system substrate-binding protein
MPKFAFAALIFLCLAQGAIAEPGITTGAVRVAVLMPLSNLYAEFGSAYMSGARAGADEVNRQGGIYGRKVQLLAFDTIPIPTDTVEQATEALQGGASEEQVFAVLGSMGQPSAAALVSLLQSTGSPLIGSATGLAAQIKQSDGLIFPVRRRDKEVVQGLVRLLETMSAVKLAVVHPRTPDALLQLQLLQDAVKGTKVSLVAQLDVGESNIDLSPQVRAIIASGPDSVLSLGSYQMTEALVRQSRLAGYKGLFATHSDVGTLRLMAELKDLSRGIGVVSGLPSPYATDLPAAREFRAAMEKLASADRHEFDEASFEGYLAVRLFAETLHRIGPAPSRREFRQALVTRPIEVAGLYFDYRRGAERGLQTPASIYVMTRDGRVSQ